MSSEAHITGQPCSKGVEDFRGVHEGKRVFVLASGPSLLDQDLERLKNRLVIGMNRSFLNYPDTHYHCMMDQRLFDLYPEETARARYVFTLKDRPAGIPLRFLGSEGFSEDLTEGIYSGYTVSYFALQLAVYMGFTQVIYLGLDLMHRQGNTHFFGFDFHSRTVLAFSPSHLPFPLFALNPPPPPPPPPPN